MACYIRHEGGKAFEMARTEHDDKTLRQMIYEVIFGFESRAGKLFDIVLICMILLSVAAVLVDSVAAYHARYGAFLAALEWFFTLAFTLE